MTAKNTLIAGILILAALTLPSCDDKTSASDVVQLHSRETNCSIEEIISSAKARAAKHGLALSLDELSPPIPNSENAFQPIVDLFAPRLSVPITEIRNNSNAIRAEIQTLLTNATLSDQLATILSNSTLRYPDRYFYPLDKNEFDLFLEIAIGLKNHFELTRTDGFAQQALVMLARYSNMTADAAVGTFDFTVAHMTARRLVSCVDNAINSDSMTQKQLIGVLQLIDQVNILQAIRNAANGDFLFAFQYVERIKTTLDNDNDARIVDTVLNYMIDRALLFGSKQYDGQAGSELHSRYESIGKDSELGARLTMVSLGFYDPYVINLDLEKERRRALIRLALAIHFKTNGDYPETLSGLAPSILAEIPDNPMTGKPFRYEPLPDGSYELKDE